MFIWKDGAIVRLLARVFLTDAVYQQPTDGSTTPSILHKQLFRSEWQYNSPDLDNVLTIQAYDNVINGLAFTTQQRSGINGIKLKFM